MSTTNAGVDNATGTDETEHRDLIATDETHVIDANAIHVHHFEGAGVVVLAQTFERTDHGLRFAGDTPIYTADVRDTDALRESLAGAGYRSHEVERVLDGEHELAGDRAQAAVRAAGSPAVATDGGQVAETETVGTSTDDQDTDTGFGDAPAHGEAIESLDHANAAVIDAGMVLQIQAPSPGATQYFAFVDGEGWHRSKELAHGPRCWSRTDAETVRSRVKSAIARNESRSVNVVKALDPEHSSWAFRAGVGQ